MIGQQKWVREGIKHTANGPKSLGRKEKVMLGQTNSKLDRVSRTWREEDDEKGESKITAIPSVQVIRKQGSKKCGRRVGRMNPLVPPSHSNDEGKQRAKE